MTDILFQNARLIDPESGRDAPGALLVSKGRISALDWASDQADRKTEMAGSAVTRIDCDGKCLAPGIVDIGVKVGEPGERHKESFRTAGLSAAAGGVTTMVCRPDTVPVIDTPETLSFALRRGAEVSPVRIAQMATLTKSRQGKEMVEIGFLTDAGAAAFSDGDRVLRDGKVLTRAMRYAASLNALVFSHPQEPTLSEGAAATSGKFASLKGLPAVSGLAERIGLERDLALAEMTGVRLHVDQLSTAAALPPLARAKAAGLDVTAGCSIHHLTLNEFDIGDYRTFFKVKPPLRAEEDRRAMVEALAEGEIDILCSMHTPQDEESKRRPFEEAASGAVGLETLLPAAMRLYHGGDLDLPGLWRALSRNPSHRFGLDGGALTQGAPADLVLFDPDAPFVLDRWSLRSKSKNTPFDGQRMQGRVLKTFVGGVEIFSA